MKQGGYGGGDEDRGLAVAVAEMKLGSTVPLEGYMCVLSGYCRGEWVKATQGTWERARCDVGHGGGRRKIKKILSGSGVPWGSLGRNIGEAFSLSL